MIATDPPVCPSCGGIVEQETFLFIWACHGCGFSLAMKEVWAQYRTMTVQQALDAKAHDLLNGQAEEPRHES